MCVWGGGGLHRRTDAGKRCYECTGMTTTRWVGGSSREGRMPESDIRSVLGWLLHVGGGGGGYHSPPRRTDAGKRSG